MLERYEVRLDGHGGGAIVLLDPTNGHVLARSETGREFRAAASRVVPDPTPARRE